MARHTAQPSWLPDWLRVALAMFAVGWGANQFASMLQVYRQQDGLSQPAVTAMFAVYIGGLMPALLLAGWWSRHMGKRPFVRTALVLAGLASALIALGSAHEWLIHAGRLVAGASAGAAMAPGTAWVTELSRGAGTGPRRATIALSSGFGLGPLVAGLAATFLPAPQVTPYLVHILVTLAALAVAWTVPEPAPPPGSTPGPGDVTRALLSRWFLVRVLPTAPWVFGAVPLAFVVMPAAVAGELGRWNVLIIGLVAGLTLGTGVYVQPHVRRLQARHPHLLLPAGLLLIIGALICGIALVSTRNPWLLLLTSPGFGAAYGTLMVGGLSEVEAHVSAHLRAPVNAVFYCLTYTGFLAPYGIAVVSTVLPAAATLGIGIAVAALTCPAVWWAGRTHPSHRP